MEDLKSEVPLAQTKEASYKKTIQEKEAEIMKVKSQSRNEQLLATSKSRVSVMRLAFKLAAPDLDDFNANQLACAIDSYDDFKKPQGLCGKKAGDRLHLWFQGAGPNAKWLLDMRLDGLPAEQAQKLETQMHQQIKLQQDTFALRSEFQEVCDEKLVPLLSGTDGQIPLPDVKNAVDRLAKEAQLVQYKKTGDRILHALRSVFEDLDKRGVDVQVALLQQLMPLRLKTVIALWGEICDSEAALKGEPAVIGKKQPELVALSLHEVCKQHVLQSC